ncbi:MAG: hypothetical protein KIT02_09595 [Devosia sp.]|uniref:hypothetical protein n=1 Tax=Devosia sp. TaxID=1871048 RepID=UPI0024CC57DA|nr:hypothetical protein [Devosia sp.]UYN98229.1 MAG: hypothetical protein KIT02_09595 [Devosia sp.]
MMRRDAVLEGVKPGDLAGLQRLALGRDRVRDDDLAGLVAKGWVELAGGMALITLAGRTLLEAGDRSKIR